MRPACGKGGSHLRCRGRKRSDLAVSLDATFLIFGLCDAGAFEREPSVENVIKMTRASNYQDHNDRVADGAQSSVASKALIGLIGLGAVGREVARMFKTEGMSVEVIGLARRTNPDENIKHMTRRTAELIAFRPQLVVEAAGHGAVAEHVIPILKAGIPVVVTSVGALADDTLRRQVAEAAEIGEASLVFPSGAIGALDYIRAVSHSSNLRIRYCSRKPVAAWTKELIARGVSLDKISCEVTLFEGTARDAALSFPQNLNVAMSLAFAGPGMEGIEVRVVADPNATGNTHEIEVESAAGKANLIFNNRPSTRNPKTSALTALSVVCAVREQLALKSTFR